MPLIEGFAHRDRLAAIVSRWMINQPRPGDVLQLKQIVNFNFYVSRLWVDVLARELLRGLHGVEPVWTRTHTKGPLKELAVDHPNTTDERIEELRARYRRFPEDFYRETPFDGGHFTLVRDGEPHLVGTTRIKRSRRIAEKGARRLVDFIFDHIRDHASGLARERAERQRVPLERLVTTPAEMIDEFRHAERRVIKSVKQGTVQAELGSLPIPDVVGIKLIVEDGGLGRLLDLLEASGTSRVVEEEQHHGAYEATNLRIVHRLPVELLRSRPPSGRAAQVLAYRGLDPDALNRDYQAFLEEAGPEVGVEVIVASFKDFLESEIGRSMHEERVLSQRSHPEYTGHLATNVRYLMDYLFALCRCPGLPEVTDVPVKLWVRYMPETIEELEAELLAPDGLSLDAFDVHEDQVAVTRGDG